MLINERRDSFILLRCCPVLVTSRHWRNRHHLAIITWMSVSERQTVSWSHRGCSRIFSNLSVAQFRARRDGLPIYPWRCATSNLSPACRRCKFGEESSPDSYLSYLSAARSQCDADRQRCALYLSILILLLLLSANFAREGAEDSIKVETPGRVGRWPAKAIPTSSSLRIVAVRDWQLETTSVSRQTSRKSLFAARIN